MSKNTKNLQAALEFAFANKPEVGGFPFLAECLRLAGVKNNVWNLPSCQSMYIFADGAIVNQMSALENSLADVPVFSEDKLVAAIRADQAGETTFPEFLEAAWKAGVVGYDVDFDQRKVSYYGFDGRSYQENYPAVEVNFIA